MRPPIECARHGQQRRAYVCEHIIQTGNDRTPRGFVWQQDAELEYEALCMECSTMPGETWAKVAPERARAVCLICFSELGKLNGIKWEAGS